MILCFGKRKYQNTGRKVWIILLNICGNYQKIKYYWKNQMSEVKKRNNPVLTHNLRYVRHNRKIYGLGKFTCERAASDYLFILNFSDLWDKIIVMFFRRRETSSYRIKIWQFAHYTCFITVHETTHKPTLFIFVLFIFKLNEVYCIWEYPGKCL